jgi:DNA-binding FrmR family transcriptional regulator
MVHATKKTTIALKKALTSLKKVMEMLEDNRYCIDIIQQNLAIIGLLRSANIQLLEGHINHCVKNAASAGDSQKLDEIMDELIKTIAVAQKK